MVRKCVFDIVCAGNYECSRANLENHELFCMLRLCYCFFFFVCFSPCLFFFCGKTCSNLFSLLRKARGMALFLAWGWSFRVTVGTRAAFHKVSDWVHVPFRMQLPPTCASPTLVFASCRPWSDAQLFRDAAVDTTILRQRNKLGTLVSLIPLISFAHGTNKHNFFNSSIRILLVQISLLMFVIP